MMRTGLYISAILVLIFGLMVGCGDRPGEREYHNALRQLERGHWVRAKDLLEKSINKRPGSDENAKAHHYLGIVAWKLGDAPDAINQFEEARRLDGKLFEAIYNLGVLHYQAGDSTRARTYLNDAAQLDLRDPRPLEFLGAIAIQNQRWTEARRILYDAWSRAPQSARILTALAVVDLHDSGEPAAVSYLMQALERDPNYPPALYNLAAIYERWPDQEEQARSFYEQYLAIAPAAERADAVRRALNRMNGIVEPEPPSVDVASPERPAPPARTLTFDDLLAEARRQAHAGNTAQAVGLCMRAAAQARQQERLDWEERALRVAVEIAPEQARTHVALGRFQLGRDQQEAARASFRRAVELEPDSSAARIALAETAAAAGEYDEALVSLRTVVASEPQNPDALWALAHLYDATLGLTNQALQAYRTFQRTFSTDLRAQRAEQRIRELAAAVPSTPAAPRPPSSPPREAPVSAERVQDAIQAYNRGVTYQQRGDWDNAIFYYRRAIENNREFAMAHYYLGAVYWLKGEYDAARQSYERTLQIQPDMTSARYNLGLLLREMGDLRAAHTQLQAVVEADPQNAAAHYALGLIYADRPATQDRARRHYGRFLELAPNDPAAPAVRQWLDRR